MPADIVGTNIVMETPSGRREFVFQKGPIFAHLILADEINRATPKTQSAMLSNFAASGDALFLHCFKHGRLRFGRGAVAFIGQAQVRAAWTSSIQASDARP